MTVEFIGPELKKLYTGEFKGKPGFNETVIYQYRKVVNVIRSAENFDSLMSFRALRIHKLKGNLKDKWSASVNMQYRIIFSLTGEKVQIVLIENLINYHR